MPCRSLAIASVEVGPLARQRLSLLLQLARLLLGAQVHRAHAVARPAQPVHLGVERRCRRICSPATASDASRSAGERPVSVSSRRASPSRAPRRPRPPPRPAPRASRASPAAFSVARARWSAVLSAVSARASASAARRRRASASSCDATSSSRRASSAGGRARASSSAAGRRRRAPVEVGEPPGGRRLARWPSSRSRARSRQAAAPAPRPSAPPPPPGCGG